MSLKPEEKRPEEMKQEELKQEENKSELEKPKNVKKQSAKKSLKLKDVQSDDDPTVWSASDVNPDYKLAVIHGANPGFECRFNTIKGSYLLYEFTQSVRENFVNNECKKSLGEIFQEIQDDLHNRGKQLPCNVFNNNTQFLKLRKKMGKSLEVKEDPEETHVHLIKQKSHSPLGNIIKSRKSSMGKYATVNGSDNDDDDDEEILNETLIDVLKMKSIAVEESAPLNKGSNQ